MLQSLDGHRERATRGLHFVRLAITNFATPGQLEMPHTARGEFLWACEPAIFFAPRYRWNR